MTDPVAGAGAENAAYSSAERAEIYDAVYADVDDAPFWLDLASRAPQGPLLELGCGTGRVLLPLARAGRAVTGLDASAHMLDRCRERLAEERPEVRGRVKLVLGDMADFELSERFAMVFSAFNSFHHLLTVEQQVGCLTRCREHLAPGGMLVLDLFNPDPAPPAVGSTLEAELGLATSGDALTPSAAEEPPDVLVAPWTGGRTVRRWMSACEYDRSAQANLCELTYEVVEPDGSTRRLVESFPLRIVYRFELEHLLARCGFRITERFGGYDGSPFAEDSLGMIVVAEAGEA